MRSTAMMARWLFVFGFAALLLASFGCSSDDSNGSVPPALACSDSGPAGADAVAMVCGGATAATTELVNVVMGGPTSGATTVRGFNFDVVYDPASLEFVPAASYTSPLFEPEALIAVTLKDGLPGRVVVGIRQVDGDPDVSFAAGQHTVLSLSFRTPTGITVAAAPLTFENAEATTASAAVAFTNGLTLAYQ
jgi:hypothetical protein